MNKKVLTLCCVILPLLTVSCAPAPPQVYHYICLPQYQLRSLDHDPTLVAKNIPVVSEAAKYSGEVGDTVIQRALFANFAGGEVNTLTTAAVPFPKTLAFVGASRDADVQALISAQDYETLKVQGRCRTSTVLSAGKALEQRGYAKNKLEAAMRWGKAMESNESRGNTILTGLPSSTSAYLAQDYDVAKLWLFLEDYNLEQREELQKTRKHQAVGLWDFTDPNSIDLVVVKELRKADDKWELDRYFLMAPSSSVEVKPTGEIVSMVWPDASDFFDQRLIYNGISGNTVKFLYREFTDAMNRNSFEQEVTYDLNLGEVIGFKGSRFVIHSASNTGIEYSILKPFNEDGVFREAEGQPR